MTAESQRPPRRRRGAALVLIGLAFALLGLLSHHVLGEQLRTWDLNAIRLERSFVLAAGEPIFAGLDHGLVLNTIYGPMAAVAYLPATLAPTLTAALRWGQGLAMLYTLLPILLLHLLDRRAHGHARWSALAFACFWAVAIDLWCLEYVTFTIHVDAPALGFGALACAGLLWRHRLGDRWGFVLSALAAVLAVWSKQVMVPLLAALPLYLGCNEGWRVAWRYGRILILTGLAASGLMIILFGPLDVLWLNLVTVPSRHPWRGEGGVDALLFGARKLVVETTMAWVLALVALGLRWTAARSPGMGAAGRLQGAQSTILCWTVALCLVPTALLGRLKVGGDANTVAYVAYFLLAGATLTLRDIASSREEPSAVPRLARRGMGVFLLLLLLTLFGVQERGALTPWRQAGDDAALPHEIAYRYSRQHPGEVYFPRLTLATYLAEGHFYHQSVGLIDRSLADFPISAAHLAANLPPGLRAVAFHRNGMEGEMRHLPLSGFSRRGSDPALPGFVVYLREEPEAVNP